MRIFLAEDEQDLNAIIVQKLTEDGYSVDHCFDGRKRWPTWKPEIMTALFWIL